MIHSTADSYNRLGLVLGMFSLTSHEGRERDKLRKKKMTTKYNFEALLQTSPGESNQSIGKIKCGFSACFYFLWSHSQA